MSQPEASIVVCVQTDFTFKQMLISTTAEKRNEALERRMVTEEVIE